MCDFMGGKKPSASTTPAYVPPAQSVTSTGVQVRGAPRQDNTDNSTSDVRKSNDSTVAKNTSDNTRRSASSGLGL